jgi:hypothetical protein
MGGLEMNLGLQYEQAERLTRFCDMSIIRGKSTKLKGLLETFENHPKLRKEHILLTPNLIS